MASVVSEVHYFVAANSEGFSFALLAFHFALCSNTTQHNAYQIPFFSSGKRLMKEHLAESLFIAFFKIA